MADTPQLFISHNKTEWTTAISVPKDGLNTLYFKIVFQNNLNIRVLFPIYNDTGNMARFSIPKTNAIMSFVEWESVNIAEQANISIKKSTQEAGIYDIVAANAAIKEAIFSLQLPPQNNFKLLDEAKFECKIQKRRANGFWETLKEGVNIEVVANTAPPIIAMFTADKIILKNNEATTLKWRVEEGSTVELFKWSEHKVTQILAANSQTIGSFPTGSLQMHTPFILKITKGNVSTTKELILKVYGKSQMEAIEGLFEGQKLLNLFTYNEKLYALCHNQKTGKEEDVFLWESYDGFDWEKSTFAGSNGTFFVSFQYEKNAKKVPAIFADSPCVVFQNKAYLIGGSRFNLNNKSKETYFYDFDNPQKGWQGGAELATNPIMGHSCLVWNNALWLIGGSTGAGASAQVFVFEGKEWRKADISLLSPRYAMAATLYNNQPYLIGGLNNSNERINLKDGYVVYKDNKWQNVPLNESVPNSPLSSCALSTYEKSLFLFSATEKEGIFTYKCQKILDTGRFENMIEGGNWLMPNVRSTINVVEFKGVLWLNAVERERETKANDIQYFIYV